MTKAELVAKIKEKAQLPTIVMAEGALDAVVASLREALAAGESEAVAGVGSFWGVGRAAGKGCNPRPGKVNPPQRPRHPALWEHLAEYTKDKCGSCIVAECQHFLRL